MGRMQVVLPDDLENEFRETVFKFVGKKKGHLSKAFEEALRQWIDTKTRTKRS